MVLRHQHSAHAGPQPGLSPHSGPRLAPGLRPVQPGSLSTAMWAPAGRLFWAGWGAGAHGGVGRGPQGQDQGSQAGGRCQGVPSLPRWWPGGGFWPPGGGQAPRQRAGAQTGAGGGQECAAVVTAGREDGVTDRRGRAEHGLQGERGARGCLGRRPGDKGDPRPPWEVS